ncbi:MAG: GntR family transcriptional regulator [Synergistales bacterium]|nr:GntR family transcriptional regulator [Synergistales bacterium]
MSRQSTEDHAYRTLMGMLLNHELPPGDRVVESEIAGELGLSRTPVRNALGRLIAQGLLEKRGSKGCYVPRLTPMDMKEVFESRITLESQAARSAAQRSVGKDLRYLRILTEREKELYRAGDRHGYTEVNKDLHLFVASLAHNSYLERFVRQTFWRSELYIFFFDRFYQHPTEEQTTLRNPEESVSCREHDALVTALESKDADRAAELMEAHIQSTYELITRRFPPQPLYPGLQRNGVEGHSRERGDSRG